MNRRVGSIEKMKVPYVLAKRYDWEGFRNFFRNNKHLLVNHIDLHHSTALHYAAHCGRPEMYKEMLQMVAEEDEWDIQRVLRMQDEKGNTPLHEVAFVGEAEMAATIIEYEDLGVQGSQPRALEPLLHMRNHVGETPVYRAAALGNTSFVNYFADELRIDMREHFQRTGDKISILHASVIGHFFGTALWLLKRYEELADLKEDNGLTTLQLLAAMPSAFRSQTQMGAFKSFIYPLLPRYQDYKYYENEEDTRRGRDLESGKKGSDQPSQTPRKLSAFSWMWYTMWKALAKVSHSIDKTWRKKEMHNLLAELVYLLATRDQSWSLSEKPWDRRVSLGRARPLGDEPTGKAKTKREEQKDQNDSNKPVYTPLLMAACNGIIEIVEVIIQLHPQSIDHVCEDGQKILALTVIHRQLKIYHFLKKLKILWKLITQIDDFEDTILHYTADYHQAHQTGSFPMLRSELYWFESIEKRIPSQYTMHCNKENKTAKQLFVEKHEGLHREARIWIKETAQSCSTVAVLVATVVYAAAYTVPGGTDDKGVPRFLRHPMFMVFTFMDVVSLASSLASVVMFLSILTSSCEIWDFRRSLPRQLMAGFALLFFSMATTMFSFTATVLINIKMDRNSWLSFLTYVAAVFPVCKFAMITPTYFRNVLEKGDRTKLWIIPAITANKSTENAQG